MFIGIAATIPDLPNLPGQGGEDITVTLDYSLSNFCADANDPTLTDASPTGGVFSYTGAGTLALNTSNGAIDISNSIPGNYIVTYTVAGVGSSNFPINITALDNATFSYSASAFCADASNQTPTITTPGGTFTTQDITFRPFQMQFEVASNTEKIIEVSCQSTGNFTIDWGDNSTILNNYTTGVITHTYNAGNSGTTIDPVISFGDTNDAGVLTNAIPTNTSKPSLIDVPKWGSMEFNIYGFQRRFQGCSNSRFQISATDAPNIATGVANMVGLFYYANPAFNSDISHWNADVGASFANAFMPVTSFNQSLNSWDVSNATSLVSVFESASSFNQDLSSWNVSSATNMSRMFRSASAFNKNLSDWYVNGFSSSLLTMSTMFFQTSMTSAQFTDTIVGWAVAVRRDSAPYNVSGTTVAPNTFDATRTQDTDNSGNSVNYSTKYGSDWDSNWTNAGDARQFLLDNGWTVS